MIEYSVGIVFTIDLKRVLLIHKNRPQWQKNRFNFPGGHVEEGEIPKQCVVREFKEETDLNTIPYDCYVF